ncbi:hypothetical protein JCM6882_001933 [Rhodosporidiobolus microsporus]
MTSVRSATYTISNGGPTLSYAVHLPPSSSANSTVLTKAALIAHPFGRLGGCKEDHVVVALARMLADEGWAVVRYDARGAGQSGGSASWTGAAEATDYRELVDQLVLPLLFRDPSAASSAASPVTETPAPSQQPETRTVDLLLCGYSFGSLAASSCPAPSAPSSHPPVRVRTSYLLLSYPLSVLWALCLFRSSPFTSALQSLVRRGENRVLAVHGDRDQFSGVERLRAWAQGLEKEQGGEEGCFGVVEVEGADHFWQDRGKKRELLEAVKGWLDAGEGK